MLSRWTSSAGFSLVEAMVSLVVISVGMIGMAALYGQGLGAGRTALYRTLAVNLAADMADRIRVNRVAGSAYEDDAAASDLCGPDGASCTPQEMAATDLFVWNGQLAEQLPSGTGSVAFAAGTPPTFTISVTWTETGIGPVTYQTAVQVPQNF
jgi:type IV pilus assembly protein PilV